MKAWLCWKLVDRLAECADWLLVKHPLVLLMLFIVAMVAGYFVGGMAA